ncbi:MAG: hypothetical protein WC791_04455 [Candidatus Paceibacterota bacterium]|jgi:hypothetical protein
MSIAYLGKGEYDIGMKKILISAVVVALAVPQIALASWWNPFSWNSNGQKTEDYAQPQNILGKTSINENTETSSVEKTNGDLKAEITALRASFDNLQKAHDTLANNYEVLLKHVNSASPSKDLTTVSNSDLGGRVTDLEKKLTYVCDRVFIHTLGFLSGCPSPGGLNKKTLEDRIKKLEGGY